MKKLQINLRKTLMMSVLLSPLFIMHSCEKEVAVENEEELITTVTYTLRPMNISIPTVVCTYKDLDGDGGNAPTFAISGPLLPNTTYEGTITLLNESESPVEDITLEVEEESADHQFFYATSSAITITYNDADTNGNPIGLKTTVKTGAAASNQSIKVTLRHEPNKSASGVKEGNIANAGGETDIEVTYNLNVQ
ncbi:MAG TPA: type 1 periplasmic binding fold superfamily protein [Saprospiraceae bacterium]|nr:type 1 periplasmic binding fold superfamily protein [Saprospiraceae bacterium]HPN71676.1 type 1 periplasmic binding fold superfamily protein [Saprospiraceae bacterium]